MERSTFVHSKLGLAPPLPTSYAHSSTLPGGVSPDQWRGSRSTTYRIPYGGRKKKYQMNRQMFRRLIHKHTKKNENNNSNRPDSTATGWGEFKDLSDTGREEEGSTHSMNNNNNSNNNDGNNDGNDGNDNGGKDTASTSTLLSHTVTDQRQPRGVTWVIKMLRQVYDDKLVAEAASFRNGYRAPTMVEYLSEWASTRYGMPALVEQMCWDLYHSIQIYREYSLEIDTFANFVDENASTEELSFYLFTRNVVLSAVNEGTKNVSKIDMNPIQIPLSVAVNITCTILKNTSPKHQMEVLFRLDQSALPERPMNTQLKLNVSNILNRGKNGNKNKIDSLSESASSSTYNKYFKPLDINTGTEEERRKNDERQALMELKERLLSWSAGIGTSSGEREINLERYLYLVCRSFRSAQRKFKRELKKQMQKEREDGSKRRHATESEFVECLLNVEDQWTPDQARAIFRQGQHQLAEQHVKEGFAGTR